MYAHKEYEIGYWRAARYRFSNKSSVVDYKCGIPVSEPGESSVPHLRYEILPSHVAMIEDDRDAGNSFILTALQRPHCHPYTGMKLTTSGL